MPELSSFLVVADPRPLSLYIYTFWTYSIISDTKDLHSLVGNGRIFISILFYSLVLFRTHRPSWSSFTEIETRDSRVVVTNLVCNRILKNQVSFMLHVGTIYWSVAMVHTQVFT